MRNVDGRTGAEYLGAAAWQGHEATNCEFPWPFLFDRITQEYDHRYGIADEPLTRIAEINFGNAKKNPRAQTRTGPLPRAALATISPSTPLSRAECANSTVGRSPTARPA